MARTTTPGAFEPEFIEALRKMFDELIVFNRTLGLRLGSISASRAEASLAMRPELIGHYGRQRLHGGVISATLDALGGIAVMAAIGGRHLDEPIAARLAHFARLGTIDLRVDFVRQAIGSEFHARAETVRLGSRVASTRMEFLSSGGELLATGAAAYIVS